MLRYLCVFLKFELKVHMSHTHAPNIRSTTWLESISVYLNIVMLLR